MFHMITDNLQAYRRAVASTATAQSITRLNPHSSNIDELVNCQADEQLKLDGLMSIIVMAIKDAAAEPPHNPFSINGDVNQPATIICNNSMMGEYENQPDHSPPPPERD